MPKSLSEGNLYAIYAVLADYRQARDQDDTQAVADIAAGLDAWLRSLLEIVKGHKVTWILCSERMPDDDRDVWAFPLLVHSKKFAPIAAWSIDEWWVDDQPLRGIDITHWAEIQWPQAPQKEGDDDAQNSTFLL